MLMVTQNDSNFNKLLENGYFFTYGLDETFAGIWVAPSTGDVYPMKGMRTASAQGQSKSGTKDDPLAAAKAAAVRPGSKATPSHMAALLDLAARVHAATQ